MSTIDNILKQFPDRISSGKQDQIFTPSHIAEEMVQVIPEEDFHPNATFLDICCKSGIFLRKIYERLMKSKRMIKEIPDEKERAHHILEKQLFGISPTPLCELQSKRLIYGSIDTGNIINFGDNYKTVLINQDRRFLLETLKEKFGEMKFNIVIGNPPYNRGGGHRFCKSRI